MQIVLRIVEMLQNVKYPTLNFDSISPGHFWAENILKDPTKDKGIPDNNLIPCKINYFM